MHRKIIISSVPKDLTTHLLKLFTKNKHFENNLGDFVCLFPNRLKKNEFLSGLLKTYETFPINNFYTFLGLAKKYIKKSYHFKVIDDNDKKFIIDEVTADLKYPHIDYNSIIQTIKEFKENNTNLEEFSAFSGSNSKETERFDKIFSRYEDLKTKAGYFDNEDVLNLFLDLLDKKDINLPGYLYLDGFFDFTFLEWKILTKLVDLTKNVYVSLLFDPSVANDNLFHRTKKVYSSLKKMSFEVTRCQTTSGQKRRPTFIEGYNKEGEIYEIAKIILQEIKENGAKLGDFAIVLKNHNAYKAIIAEVFDYFRIPYNFSFTRKLADNNLFKAFLDFITILESDWKTYKKDEAILDFLTNSLTKIESRLCSKITHDYNQVGTLGSYSAWIGFLEKYEEEKLINLLKQIKHIDEETKKWGLQEFTDLVFKELIDSESYANNDKETGIIFTTFNNSVAAHDKRSLSKEELLRSFQFIVKEISAYCEKSFLNRVNIIDTKRIRYYKADYIFVCGLIEKEFPCLPSKNNSVLPEKLKQDFFNKKNLPISNSYKQYLDDFDAFYNCMVNANKYCGLSYPKYDENNNFNEPSIFIKEDLKQDDSFIKGEPFYKISGLEQAKILERKLDAPPNAYKNKLLGKTFSPTELKDFHTCPFKHFASFVLGLKYEPYYYQFGLNYLSQGAIIHEVLNIYYTKKEQDIIKIFENIFELKTNNIRLSFFEKKIKNELRHILLSFVINENKFNEIYKTKPCFFELSFGKKGNPDFIIQDREGDIKINGKIDRIDTIEINNNKFGIVIDYKNSKTGFTSGYKREIEEGYDLQLPIYLFAIEKAFGISPLGFQIYALKKGERTGILHSDYKENIFNEDVKISARNFEIKEYFQELEKTTFEHIKYNVNQIRNGEISPKPIEEQCCKLENCKYQALCRYPLD